jgi:hypothetical protein
MCDSTAGSSTPYWREDPIRTLAGDARLRVKSYGVGIGGMCPLQICEFNELMPQEAGVSVGDEQVAFPRVDRKPVWLSIT